MALSGLEIFKLLPKTNCQECGLPTCLAFAMNLSAGKTELSACPYVSEEAKAKLAEAEASPIRLVAIGVGDKALKVGGETVMFRHEKRFENPPGFAILISDTMDGAEVDARLKKFQELQYERIGHLLRPELAAIRDDSGDAEKYSSLVNKVIQNSDANIIMMSNNADVLSAGLEVCAEQKPLIYAATPENVEQMADLAMQHSCPVTAKASGLEELSQLTTKLNEAGVKDIVLDSGSRTLRRAFEDQIFIRRAAIYKNFRPLCFPTIVFPFEMTHDLMMETLMASVFVAKYAGIIVFSDFQGETLYPLLLQRMDIYNDPQAPLKVPEGVYEIGKPDKNSPVLLTSSWALTYLNLTAALEGIDIPVFLCIESIEKETDVMCWCRYCLRSTQRGKLDPKSTDRFIRECGVGDRVNHRKLVIPGRSAQFQADLEKALPEWEIIVGPPDAALITGFLPGFAEGLKGHKNILT
jgi:acetyl-CoA decarbonylase/synthase complex subunit gamma